MIVDAARTEKEKILKNMVSFHETLSQDKDTDIKLFHRYSVRLLKLTDKFYKGCDYVVSENDGNGGDDPPEDLKDPNRNII